MGRVSRHGQPQVSEPEYTPQTESDLGGVRFELDEDGNLFQRTERTG